MQATHRDVASRGTVASAGGAMTPSCEALIGATIRLGPPSEPLGYLLALQGITATLACVRDPAWVPRMALEGLGGTLGLRWAAPVSPLAGLTPREVEVLDLVTAGKQTSEIAAALTISGRTVGFHVDNLKKKLGARTRTDLVRLAHTGRAPAETHERPR